MNKPRYHIRFLLYSLRYEYDVFSYDFDVTYVNCFTMYFKDGGRIVVDADSIEELEITLIQ